jgi:spermidine synthase
LAKEQPSRRGSKAEPAGLQFNSGEDLLARLRDAADAFRLGGRHSRRAAHEATLNWYFLFFFFSGFCSVLYELVWLRLSMAQFGVTTAMVSIVLSVFMAGLGFGSWAGGRWADSEQARKLRALRIYAVIEFLIGISGLLVSSGLLFGHRVLEHFALSSSLRYYCFSGSWVALTLLPWCALMGATVPVGMLAIRQTLPAESGRSFSYLYMANVGGAVFGTTIPLLLIEVAGFRGTLKIGVACNFLITVSALILATRLPQRASIVVEQAVKSATSAKGDSRLLTLLFFSGLTCMGMEVVWVRAYTPYLGTVVYAFASILGVYLLTTFIGSVSYRRWSSRWTKENPAVWTALAFVSLLPLIGANPAIQLSNLLRLFVGVGLFTGLIGFLTPMLVDRYSNGDPGRAGYAYATNVVGCILGPLLAGFGLLPFLSERWALVALTIPWMVVGLAPLRSASLGGRWRAAAVALMAGAGMLIVFGKGYEDTEEQGKILRDPTATVIATGTQMDKKLLVNGYGMTTLTPITKVMAHLPLAFLDRTPQNALVICFGMGTTFRSLHSWGIPVTAVELVPSVPRLFSYYHPDGDAILASPLSHVVIDDGRRYLERTSQQYDVITIDPPPPLSAAASSLLYSEEFYRAARMRLRRGGILQQWLPATVADSPVEVAAITRSMVDSFPYVRAFPEEFGIHFLGSNEPIPTRTAEELVRRMPGEAVADLAEWDVGGGTTARQAALDRISDLLKGELAPQKLMAGSPETPALSDDRPINEYYALRKWVAPRGTPTDRAYHN